MTLPPLRVVLAQPRGFCAGVERAIEIVERALERFGPPVYVRHEIVHNKHVVEALKSKGARFVDEVDEIPEGAVTIFSAHGVAASVATAAGTRSLRVIDAACPLVTKVHKEGGRYAASGYDVVLIGHAGHPEVEGTMGRINGRVHLISKPEDVAAIEPSDPAKLAFVTQTTLSVDDTRDVIEALKARFPAIVGPDTRDICYATQNRQTAVRGLAREVDLILVVGAQNSSNSNRLREIGEAAGTPSYLIESAERLDLAWLGGARTVGITAGASAPELLVQDLIARLRDHYLVEVEVLAGIEENVHFRLPAELAGRSAPAPTAA
ncbi:MAG TPA: 4-hydroxy-3-methylbut-2-enyl diphosphate reductase [Geminicoccaceae bacterium]|jgi:4-hydroxy-3-methylbut-2-enyl diphosphate reductase|nr:4-hydroxy-3-methylbut-2-enyl diphosphate reductase [Geminicoccaceae bacterium]